MMYTQTDRLCTALRCASSGSDSVSLDVSGAWGGWGLGGWWRGDWRIQMESHSHAALKCRLKYCNYEASAHDRTVVITSQKVGIAEWHFAVVCLSLAHRDTHTHTHIYTKWQQVKQRVNINAAKHQLSQIILKNQQFLFTISETQTGALLQDLIKNRRAQHQCPCQFICSQECFNTRHVVLQYELRRKST